MAQGLSSCGTQAQQLWLRPSLLQGLWNLSSPARDQTQVPCIARWILNPRTSMEVPLLYLLRTTVIGFRAYPSNP